MSCCPRTLRSPRPQCLDVTTTDDAASSAQLLVAASGIREGAGNLVDGVLPLVSALQAVAKIHPWLEGV